MPKPANSVQAQIERRTVSMRRRTMSFRAGTAYPDDVNDLLARRLGRPSVCVLVEDRSMPEVYLRCFEGVIMVPSGAFIEFEVDLDQPIENRLATRDVSARFVVDHHMRGIGLSEGAVATVVQRELAVEGDS